MSHVAIGVRAMEPMVSFYRDVAGLEVMLDTEERLDGDERFPGFHRRTAYLKHDRDEDLAPFLVLDQHLDRAPFGEPAQLLQLGIHHFAFWVDDVDAVAERVRAAGFEPTHGPSDTDTAWYGEPAGGIVRTMFVQDPEGNVVQFDQRVRGGD